MITTEQLHTIFSTLKHPYSKCTFTGDDLPVCHFDQENQKLTITFNFPQGQTEQFQAFSRQLLKILKIDFEIPSVKFVYATDETPHPAHDANTTASPKNESKAQFIGIVSGKGGVGKSQTTLGLAQALKRRGEKVAIIDADVYGASIQKILGNNDKALQQTNSVKPLIIDDMEIVSSPMFSETNAPIIWRGPMLGKLLNHFINDIEWSEDNTFYLIDLPPGTGDIPLDLQQLVPNLEVIVVTTPDDNAAFVAAKSGIMARNMQQHVIGVIENMSYFIGNDGVRYHIFGKGGGVQIAKVLNVPLLAQIPISSQEAPLAMEPYFDQIIATLM